MEDMGVKGRGIIEPIKRLLITPFFLKVAYHFGEFAVKNGFGNIGEKGKILLFRPSLIWGGAGLTLVSFLLHLRRLGYEPIVALANRPSIDFKEDNYQGGNSPSNGYVFGDYKRVALIRLLRMLDIEVRIIGGKREKCPIDDVLNEYEEYWARVSAFRYYRLAYIDGELPAVLENIYRQRRKQFEFLRCQFFKTVREVSPVWGVVWHGDLPFGGDALFASYWNYLKIPFLTIIRGIRENTVQLKWDGTFASPYNAFFEKYAISDEIREKFMGYWENRISHKVRDTRYGGEDTESVLDEVRRRRSGRRVIWAFPNVIWDGSLYTAYKYISPLDWIISLVKWAKRYKKEVFLVIRMHPHEALYYPRARTHHFIMRFIKHVPDNVLIIPPEAKLSSYKVVESMPDATFTVYNGTIGLEIPLLIGKKAVLAGNAHYSKKGFTIDTNSLDEYFNALVENIPYGDNEVYNKALLYASYYFIFSQLYYPIVENRRETENYLMFPAVLKDFELYPRWEWYLSRLSDVEKVKYEKESLIY